MSWSRFIRPAQRRFRRKRAHLIVDRFPGLRGATVVDVGGALPFWREVFDIIRPEKVLIFNIRDSQMRMGVTSELGPIELHVYDGRRLPLDDGWADYVFCNSVVEHVAPDARNDFAREIIRVGRRHIVQTPARAFPLELHFGLPFVHWLPRWAGRKLVRVSPFQLLSNANAQQYFDSTQLLSPTELAEFFPELEIITERFLGIPKSMLAVTPSLAAHQPGERLALSKKTLMGHGQPD